MNFKYSIKLISNSFIKIYKNKKLILIFIFCLSILASSFFLIFLKNIGPEEHKIPSPSDYTTFYKPVAESISQGKGIPIKEHNIGTRYPIGYPLILSLLFSISGLIGVEKMAVIVVFNILATALAGCFLFLFVKVIFSKKIALISALLWITYPLNLWFIKNPNTEVPFILLFYLALWIYILGIEKRSFRLFLVSGVLIGFMSLIRPISVFLPIPLVILIFFLIKKTPLRQKILFSFILITAYVAVVSPWIIYVYFNTGKIILLSTSGPAAISLGLTFVVDEIREESLIILPDDVLDLINRSRTMKMDNFLNLSIFFLRELIDQPIAFSKLIAIKMARSWYATSEMWWEKEILLVQLLYLIPGVTGIVLWFKKFKGKIPYLIFLLIIIFYFWLATTVALSILRYMIPIMGIFMIFLAITINRVISKLVESYKNETRRNSS